MEEVMTSSIEGAVKRQLTSLHMEQNGSGKPGEKMKPLPRISLVLIALSFPPLPLSPAPPRARASMRSKGRNSEMFCFPRGRGHRRFYILIDHYCSNQPSNQPQ